MVLVYGWIILIWLVILAGVAFLYKRRFTKAKAQQERSKTTTLRVAHTRRITGLPEYSRRLALYRRLLIAALVLLGVSLLLAIILSARPAKQSVVTPAQKNRDIMLCLDVSPSMTSADIKIVETFQALAAHFDGQRIGLDVYNYSSSQQFPLTDDYGLIHEQLDHAKKALGVSIATATPDEYDEVSSFYIGTSVTSTAGIPLPSSNTGIGLAGCIQHLGDNKSGRSQSIILATDNEMEGVESDAIVTAKQALLLAKKKGVRVYSLDPGVFDLSSDTSDPNRNDDLSGSHETLKTYTLITGGNYYRLSSNDVVPDIISNISAQEAKLYTGNSQYAVTDTPTIWFILLCLSVAGLGIITWRLKL